MNDIRDILDDLGYVVHDNGREFRMNPLYRDSSSSSVLRVYKDTGWFTDFKACKAGPFEELVRLTLGVQTLDQAKSYIYKNYDFVKPKKKQTKLECDKFLPKELLLNLVQDYSYWNKRGISRETLELFQGGVATRGKFYQRYIFPIFNSRDKLVGVTGRDVSGKNPIKWLHQGSTSKWAYPLQINYKIINKVKEIIIIESIGDMLSLWEAGIKNCVVTHGVKLSPRLLSIILRLNPKRITIALNNDGGKEGAGNQASEAMYKILTKHFDEETVQTKLPVKNDFGCMNKKEILEWQNK